MPERRQEEGGNNIKWTDERRENQSKLTKQNYIKDPTLRERTAHKGKQNGMYGIHRYGSENPCYGTHLSEETKNKISMAHKGKVSPNKGKKLSAITKQKMSETRIKNIKNGKIKIDYSYRIGVPPANKGKIAVYKDKKQIYIDSTELDNYLKLGYIKGSVTKGKSKNYSAIKNKMCVNNGLKNKYIFNNELEDYLKNGYKIGGISNNKNHIAHNKNKIGVRKDNIKIYIDKTDLQEYLNKGYVLGWNHKKKGKTND